MRWSYRCRQVLMRMKRGDAAVAREVARRVLPPAAYALFEMMPPGDQIHALCVFRTLGGAESMPPEMAQAALLHDVGKAGGRLTGPRRALMILLESVGGGLLERLALAEPGYWRYPFHVHLHHAEIGASLCQEAGCPPLVVALVRGHESPSESPSDDPRLTEGLAALHRADESC